MVECLDQQRDAEPQTDERCRPEGLDRAGQVGQRCGAVDQRPRPGKEQRQPAQHTGQIFQRVPDAHDREGHRMGGIAVLLRIQPPAWCFLRGGEHLDRLTVGEPVLKDDACQHEQHKQPHQQAGAGVAKLTVPHKDRQHTAGGQQQHGLAAKLIAVSHSIPAAAQQADSQRQPQIGDGTGQCCADRQRRDRHACSEERQHQLRQCQTKGRNCAPHDPHRQTKQRTAPSSAAPRQPAAHRRKNQTEGVNQKCCK